MYGLSRKSSMYILIMFILLSISSVINKNYVVSALFLISIIGASLITRAEGFYENLYYTLLVSSMFEYASYFPRHEKLYYFHVVLVVCAIFTFVKLLTNRYEFKNVNKKLLGFYVIWFVYICASFLWAKNKDLNIKYIEIYAMMFAFVFIVVMYNTSKEKFYNSLKVVGFVFILTIAVGMVEAISGTQLPVKHYYDSILYKLTAKELIVLKSRPVVFFFNTNNYATFLTIGLPFLMFAFYYANSRIKKITYGVVMFFGFTAMMLANSRSNILAMVLIIGAYTLLVFMDGKLKALIYPLIIIVAFFGVYKYSYVLVKHGQDYEQKMIEKMGNMTNISSAKIGEEGSENVRFTIMVDIVDGVIKGKRPLGFGAGNSIQHLQDMNNTHGIYSVHGLAVELLGDFGVFLILYGLFYLYLLYKLFMIGIRGNSRDRCIAYSLLTSLIGFTIGSFSPSSVTYFLPNWLLFALSISFIQANSMRRNMFGYE